MGKKRTKTSLASIRRRALPILRRHSVKRAAIFGSYARGTAKARSDIDFLIEYKGNDKTLFDLVDLKSDLEETFERKVDIVTYSSIYWRIRDRILSEQIEIL
jgi:predicted nucleotidyltransferase